MSMYTTAQLLAANEQKFKFDPLFLRLFFRESYPFTTEKVYLSQIPGLVNMALYVSPIVSGEVIRSRGGSTSEFTPGYVKPKHEVNPQMTLRRLPDEDPQNLADPAYRRRRIIMQNMRDEELAIAQNKIRVEIPGQTGLRGHSNPCGMRCWILVVLIPRRRC